MKQAASILWKEKLRDGGYAHSCASSEDVRKIRKMSRVWRKALAHTGLRPPARLLEIGCGGGIHLAALALNGFEVQGIDISPEVVDRCNEYFRAVRQQTGTNLSAQVRVADVFSYESNDRYDMTYHFGVVEHFLELEERMEIWKRMSRATRKNGWVMSVVPNGSHYWRARVRRERLCGYDIPEVDYSVEMHEEEFRRAGLRDVIAIPWNYFGFLAGIYNGAIERNLSRPLFMASNIFLPVLPIPRKMKERFAHSLIVFGRKQ